MSELVTNACQAMSPLQDSRPISLTLTADPGFLLIRVWDAAPGIPVLQPNRTAAQSGHGLHIVLSLCDEWGHYRARPGKAVWALIETSTEYLINE